MAVARRFEELIAWQLSARLRDIVIGRSATWRFRDEKLWNQLRDAVRSAPRNLAEGFGRFKPREFAHFTRIARASLLETLNHLQDARQSKYMDAQEVDSLIRLNKRALKATTRLLKYLESCKGKAPTGWDVNDKQTNDDPKAGGETPKPDKKNLKDPDTRPDEPHEPHEPMNP